MIFSNGFIDIIGFLQCIFLVLSHLSEKGYSPLYRLNNCYGCLLTVHSMFCFHWRCFQFLKNQVMIHSCYYHVYSIGFLFELLVSCFRYFVKTSWCIARLSCGYLDTIFCTWVFLKNQCLEWYCFVFISAFILDFNFMGRDKGIWI